MIINKLPLKKLIEFSRFSEYRQSNFANKLLVPKDKNTDDEGGGDYWVRSKSGLSTSFKYNDNTIVKERLESLINDHESEANKKTKIMYQRNIDILHNYEDFDFSIWRPSLDLNFLPKPRASLTIKNIPIQIIPTHVFSYKEKDEKKVGAILFVTWLEGFRVTDLATFSDALFRYITFHYSTNYEVEPRFCLTVDAANKQTVGYHQILSGEIPSLLESSIATLKKYLN